MSPLAASAACASVVLVGVVVLARNHRASQVVPTPGRPRPPDRGDRRTGHFPAPPPLPDSVWRDVLAAPDGPSVQAAVAPTGHGEPPSPSGYHPRRASGTASAGPYVAQRAMPPIRFGPEHELPPPSPLDDRAGVDPSATRWRPSDRRPRRAPTSELPASDPVRLVNDPLAAPSSLVFDERVASWSLELESTRWWNPFAGPARRRSERSQ